jgi:TfoX/Sxy family transcriptional regulator of competence genes
MVWVKIPKEHHALFYASLPADPRVETLQMFGAAAAKVNDRLFGGLFARSFMVKLGPADLAEALALEGAEPFDPMGNGRVMGETVLMPESMMEQPEEMKAWLAKAFAHVVNLAKKKRPPTKPVAAPRGEEAPARSAKKPKTNKGVRKRK